MEKPCKYHKLTYKNGEITLSRCTKLNKNISIDYNNCMGCDYNNPNNYEKINPDNIIDNMIDIDFEKPINKKELFRILSSTFNIITKEMEELDKRLKIIENKTGEKNESNL